MIANDLPDQWAHKFGLAITPLFEGRSGGAESHAVLLDGGYGSFAMSVSQEELWRDKKSADWAWSSNLPHHVTVTEKAVAVTRWDRQNAEVLSRSSVDNHIESFYAYLLGDRVRSTSTVVDHAVSLFRRVRSLVADVRLPDDRSVDAFLALLAVVIERDKEEDKTYVSADSSLKTDVGSDLLKSLSQPGINALLEDVMQRSSGDSFRLFPSLAVRHAGSEIFQEAHFELLRAPGLDLFGYPGVSEAIPVTRGGAHFTPAPLARTVVEQALLQVENLFDRQVLTILDPACGSGAFLQEAIRTLRRMDFKGDITIVGRDISVAAISMAQFVVQHASIDWAGSPRITIDIAVADSLTDDLPRADLVLMNPPFVSWAALSTSQRDHMRQVLGKTLQGRGDLSMAFITRSLRVLAPGGSLGVLFPSSITTLQAAELWRTELLEHAELRFLASLGEYGLFAHATVQIAAAVLAKPSGPNSHSDSTVALITKNSAEATGNALRTLRRTAEKGYHVSEDSEWSLFTVAATSFVQRPTWRLLPPKTDLALARLWDSGALRMGDLFDIHQGVRTGENRAFNLEKQEFESLPSKEKKFFRPAVMNNSIQDGKLRHNHWIFYPYEKQGPVFTTEEKLLDIVPVYATRFLLPYRDQLAERSSLVRSNRLDWWSLSWERSSWAFDQNPRMVSKYFGGPSGFALDLSSEFIIVQGFAWFLKDSIAKERHADDDDSQDNLGLSQEDLLCAYVALVNSDRFGRVLELFSAHVAGGQFDLSPRYVNHIPIPNLADLATDERSGRMVARLVELGREPRVSDADWRFAANRITADLYGSDFFVQV